MVSRIISVEFECFQPDCSDKSEQESHFWFYVRKIEKDLGIVNPVANLRKLGDLIFGHDEPYVVNWAPKDFTALLNSKDLDKLIKYSRNQLVVHVKISLRDYLELLPEEPGILNGWELKFPVLWDRTCEANWPKCVAGLNEELNQMVLKHLVEPLKPCPWDPHGFISSLLVPNSGLSVMTNDSIDLNSKFRHSVMLQREALRHNLLQKDHYLSRLWGAIPESYKKYIKQRVAERYSIDFKSGEVLSADVIRVRLEKSRLLRSTGSPIVGFAPLFDVYVALLVCADLEEHGLASGDPVTVSPKPSTRSKRKQWPKVVVVIILSLIGASPVYGFLDQVVAYIFAFGFLFLLGLRVAGVITGEQVKTGIMSLFQGHGLEFIQKFWPRDDGND